MSARRRKNLPVIYAPRALKQLDEIWDWNEQIYSRSHAARYIDFLERRIDAIGEIYQQGWPVESHPGLYYLVIRRKAKRHGHIAVYRFDDKLVEVLYLFHTAQDWQSQLASESPDN